MNSARSPVIERIKGIVAVMLFLSVSGLFAHRTATNLNVIGSTDQAEFGMADFRDVGYYPVVALLDGVNPYDPELFRAAYPVYNHFPPYSPLTIVLHFPFGILPLGTAEAAYFIFTLVLTVLTAGVVLRCCEVELSVPRVFVLSALMLLSRPGYSNLAIGQSTAIAMLALITALHVSRSRPILAGLALGVATFKPQFGVPLAILMLFRGDYRAVVVGAGVAVAGATLPAIFVLSSSDGGIWALANRIFENTLAFKTEGILDPVGVLLRLDALSVVTRVFGFAPHSIVTFVLIISILATCGWVVWRTRNTPDGQGADSTSSAVIILALLTSVYHMSYDALVLWMPLMAVILGSRDSWRTLAVAHRRALVVALTIPLVNYLATYVAVGKMGISGTMLIVVASINGAAIFVALCLAAVSAHRVTVETDASILER